MSEDASGPARPAADQGEQGVNERKRNPRPRGSRPRPRGGLRERERRERAANRAARLQEGDDNRDVDAKDGAAEGQPAAGGGPGGGGGDGRRGGRQGNQGRGGGQSGGRGRESRLNWRPAADESTGEPLSREALWAAASRAAAASRSQRDGSSEDASAAADPDGQDQDDGEPFEDGHMCQIARDHKTGRVVAVREMWMSSAVRRKPRQQSQGNINPSGGDGMGSGAAANADRSTTPGGDQGGEDAAAIQRIMERLDL